MLDSNQIERALESNGFSLEIDNTHARGFRSTDKEHLLFVKTSKKRKINPLVPIFKQPLVLHWSIKNSNEYSRLESRVVSINSLYKNDNMRGFQGPKNSDKPNGVAINIESPEMLADVLAIIGVATKQQATIEEDIAVTKPELDSLPETTRKSLVDARIGQGQFREELVNYWKGCAVTGCKVHKMLRASHIKPWRDSDNADRLDPFNGLLLTANLDLAFDQGFISFDSDGSILIKSDQLNKEALTLLSIKHNMKLLHIADNHQSFLAEHRRLHNFEKGII